MIKYYGTPITSKNGRVFSEAMPGRNALVSFANRDDLKRAIKHCHKIILDNGAFSTWNNEKKGKIKKVNWAEHWKKFYVWVGKHISDIDYFFIPDVIDGTEEENDALIVEFFKKFRYDGDRGIPPQVKKAIPIWHVNESLERLSRLATHFDYIAIGSAGEFAQLGTPQWHNKMDKAMRVICDANGYPRVKIHMLRCLDSKIFLQYPFYSGDSTTLAQNHKRDGWRNIVARIEKYDSPERYEFKTYYETPSLFEEVA